MSEIKKIYLSFFFIFLLLIPITLAGDIFLYINPSTDERLTNHSVMVFNTTNPPPEGMVPIYYYIDGLVVGDYQVNIPYASINITLLKGYNNFTFNNVINYSNDYIFENFSDVVISDETGYFFSYVPYPGIYNITINYNNLTLNTRMMSFVYFDYPSQQQRIFFNNHLTLEEETSCQNTKFIIYGGFSILSLFILISAVIGLFVIIKGDLDAVVLFSTISGIICFIIIIFTGIYVIGLIC